MQSKVCTTCKIEHPLDFFPYDKTKPTLYKSNCKDCCREIRRRSRQKRPEVYRRIAKNYGLRDPERLKNNRLKSAHKITVEQFKQILAEQGNVCKICKQSNNEERGYVVDHDHNCCPKNKSCDKCRRGIICQSCNKTLGFAKDNPEILQNAIDYLLTFERNKNGHF